jgi:DMSO/TMAO reductase YedYZ molybdopterin-dependent catalytic subunit
VKIGEGRRRQHGKIKKVSAVDLKLQNDAIPCAADLPPGVIVSPDTLRSNRLPPGQARTRKWPVLDASGPPRLELSRWRLKLEGLIEHPVEWDLTEFLQLNRVRVFSDFHCVTRWSRLGNLWEGVPTRRLVELAGGLRDQARFVIASGYDYGWTANLPVDDFLAEDALVAILHDGEPIPPEHGGPARLVIPRLYAWKSAKWLSCLKFVDEDNPGFWERNGYHMRGDPWKEERYGW